MYVSRLAFSTVPGKTGEVERALGRLRNLVEAAGGGRPRVLRTHYASLGAPDTSSTSRGETMTDGSDPSASLRRGVSLQSTVTFFRLPARSNAAVTV